MWLFPLVSVLGALILSGLQLSGSSIGALDPQLVSAKHATDPNLLYGIPRGIRSDEWLLSSPAAIGNVRRGFPTQVWVGLTDTYLPAAGLGVPSRHWSELFRPGNWAFHLVPVQYAFAWRWWSSVLVGLLGAYALLIQLTHRPLISAALAVALALSPYSAWWSLSSAPVLGYLAASVASLLFGMQRRAWWATALWGSLAGVFATGAGLLMYPPWLVSVGLVMLTVIVGTAVDRKVGWRRFVTGSAAALVVFVPAMLQWAREAAPTLAAMAGTIYPGNRISPSGGGSLRWLLDAPASLWWSGVPGVHPPDNLAGTDVAANGLPLFSNVSEASSTWFPLPLVLLAVASAAVAFRHGRRVAPDTGTADAASRDTTSAGGDAGLTWLWTTVLVAAVMLLLLAWALLPLPEWVGALTLLNRVPGYRTPLALGTASAVLLAIGAAALDRSRLRAWFVALVAVATAASVAGMMWAILNLHWQHGQHPTPRSVATVCLAAGLGFGLLLLGRRLSRVGAVIVIMVAAAVFVPVNPFYRGLGPMDDDPVVTALRPYVTRQHAPRAAVYGNDVRLNALVVSTGMVSLTGLTIFPDRAYWERVDPAQESLWNNYVKYHWIPDAGRDKPSIEMSVGTERLLRVNPCAAQTRELGIDFSVASVSLASFSCLQLIRTVTHEAGPVYIYRYAS
jgi:hypothetical protein